MNKFIFLFCVLGLLSILLGAFGAHVLKNIVTPDRLQVFETAVRYQMHQALFGLAVGLYAKQMKVASISIKLSLQLSLIGILIFSGSLYLLVTLDQPWIGAITPIGGFLLLLSWLLVALFFIREPELKSADNKNDRKASF